MKKEASVVMLPTDKSMLIHHKSDGRILSPLKYPKDASKKYQPFHLYFINDEKVKESDYYVNEVEGIRNVLYCEDKDEAQIISKNTDYKCKKIIATTDPELRSDGLIEDPNNPKDNLLIRKGLPQPSQAFIEKYCKVGGIDEVMVEYEENITAIDNLSDVRSVLSTEEYVSDVYKTYTLKVDSHNTITIHSIKDSWSREEVASLCYDAFTKGVEIEGDFEDLDAYWKTFEKKIYRGSRKS